MAVWVRLLELPIEFYDASVLREIGGAIGPVLRIDSYMASGTRGSYARLCLQIDLTKPLITTIRVGRLKQKVMYEGISLLCFSCGRIGHKVDSCPHHIRPHTLVGDEASSSNTAEKQTPHHNDQNDHNYGEWMIVTRKRNPVITGRNRGAISPTKAEIPNCSGTKGNAGNQVTNMPTYNPDLTFRFGASASHLPEKTVGPSPILSDSREMYMHRKNGAAQKSSVHIPLDPTVSQKSDQLQGSMSTQPKSTKTSRDKKLSKTKGSIGLKRPNPSAENTNKPQRSSPSGTNQ